MKVYNKKHTAGMAWQIRNLDLDWLVDSIDYDNNCYLIVMADGREMGIDEIDGGEFLDDLEEEAERTREREAI